MRCADLSGILAPAKYGPSEAGARVNRSTLLLPGTWLMFPWLTAVVLVPLATLEKSSLVGRTNTYSNQI
jgi:hypothetical protein